METRSNQILVGSIVLGLIAALAEALATGPDGSG